MAKTTTVPAATLARARALLTATEHRIFTSSFGQALSKATHAEVDALARQARVLRDKWRGLTSKQTRSTKRTTGPAKEANARSAEKTDLLHGALERLEARLTHLAGSVSATVTGLVRGNSAAKARTKTIARRAARRTAARPVAPSRPAATVKTAAKLPAAAPAKTSVAAASKLVAKTPVKAAAGVGSKPSKNKISKKARQAGALSALQTPVGTQKLTATRANQRNALSAAKANRLKITGLDTRRTSHAAARVKSMQARRDMRSR